MKTQTAKLNHLRMAPRKVRLVASMIKGLSINDAQAQLMLNPRRASEPVLKLLQSAIANAKNNNKDINVEKLIVKEIRVDGGPMLKRWLPRAQGRATPIQKKSSHITIVLAESEKIKKARFTIEKPVRIKKSEAEKIKREEAKEKEVKKDLKKESKKEDKAEKKKVDSADKGFTQKVFRRKSI